jgi:hypothetical protein
MPDKTVPQHTRAKVYSPCFDPTGKEYCLIVLEGRHPNVKDSPLRVHGVGAKRDLARANALSNWDRAYRRLWESPPSRSR